MRAMMTVFVPRAALPQPVMMSHGVTTTGRLAIAPVTIRGPALFISGQFRYHRMMLPGKVFGFPGRVGPDLGEVRRRRERSARGRCRAGGVASRSRPNAAALLTNSALRPEEYWLRDVCCIGE